MTATIRSVGSTLLIQCVAVEAVSVALFSQTPAGVVVGLIAPWIGFLVACLAFIHRGSFSEVLVSGCVALPLFGASLVLWLRYRKRIAAHVTLALFSVLSMAMLLGAI
jgi:hypothetical protein